MAAMKPHQLKEEELVVTAHVVDDQHAFVVTESVVGDQIGVVVEMPPALVAVLNALNNNINVISNNMNQRFNAVDSQLANIEARQTNFVARQRKDPIRVITGPGGKTPPDGLFPNTYGQLLDMGPHPCRQLLMFYGMPPGPSVTRNQRLCKFLGAH